MRGGSGAFIADTDPLAHEPFVVAADLDGKADRARIRLAAAVDVDDVIESAAEDIKEQRTLSWNGGRDDLVETVERRLGAIRLGAQDRRPSPSEADHRRTDEARPRDPARRARLVGRQQPDSASGSTSSTAPSASPGPTGRSTHSSPRSTPGSRRTCPERPGAATSTDSTSRPCCDHNCRGPRAPNSIDSAPTRSNSRPDVRYPVDYSGERPTASVRVQDLFGTTEHPTAGGDPIRLELLSPADRPIQVTADLPGFWAGSWAEVKKEMAGRYPKHRWPDDPASAPPKRMKDR